MNRPITTSDLREFLSYVNAHKDEYDDFNVIQVETVLGSLLHFCEAKK